MAFTPDDNGLLALEDYKSSYIQDVRLSKGWEDVDLTVSADFDIVTYDNHKIHVEIKSTSLFQEYIKKDGFYAMRFHDSYVVVFIVDRITTSKVREVFDTMVR